MNVRVNGRPETQPTEDENSSSMFSRINERRFYDTEEVRYDIPATLASADIYIGVAIDGTATANASWTVVRYYFDSGSLPVRARIRENVAWDDRATGW